MILDPPYSGSVKIGFDKSSTYRNKRIDAHSFCVEYMRMSDAWCLFEKPGSMLARMAMEKGAVEIQRKRRNRMTANEVMMVLNMKV